MANVGVSIITARNGALRIMIYFRRLSNYSERLLDGSTNKTYNELVDYDNNCGCSVNNTE